ncbi:MAG: class I SAM-dependent methyltransferase [Candidatus Hydrogenedentes bacterium]|nr:class I SAM-dependent methyltransferase [Candidatus Hydrogenedentota bacterium]
MEVKEFETMYRVEDLHWWYVGLREILSAAWREYVPARPDLRLLDVGCGTGANLRHFAPHAAAAGIDFTIEALRWCRKRGLSQLAAASAIDLPFGAGSFDVAISCNMLGHINVPGEVPPLREIYRALRPGGVFLLNVAAYQWLCSSHDAAVHNTRRYTRAQTVQFVEAASFDVLHATYWNTALLPPAICVRLWRKFFSPGASDLADEPGAFENRVCGLALAVERQMLRWSTLPAGLSIFVVARKP